MKKISLAFFGSPDFAANFLEKLITDPSMYRYIEVKLIVTQPDQKVGRKQILTPTPVNEVAKKAQIPILNDLGVPEKGRVPTGVKNAVSSFLNGIDLALVYAYGDLIPKELLNIPKYGFCNIHPSLLPKYRGPSPIATPLINGDKTTGVTIIKMDEEIDHGPIIAQESLTIENNDRRPNLEKKLADLGFEMFKKTVVQLTGSRVNELKTKEQNHNEATYTKKLSKQDGFIEISKLKDQISKNSEELFNLFRGLSPWPGIWTLLRQGSGGQAIQKRLKITGLEFTNGKLIINKVQLEGKNEVDFETFNKAYKMF